MSAPLNLTADQLRKLSHALDAMTEITQAHGVDLAPYSGQQLGLDGNTLTYTWDGQAYVIDDRNGE